MFLGGALLCLLPAVGTTQALAGGILLSLILGNPFPAKTSLWSRQLLQLSVVGLGFGLNIGEVWRVGRSSVGLTLLTIIGTVLVGRGMGRLYDVPRNTAALLSFGTAICGGSAIAALAPVLKAEDDETAVSLATVFTLNAAALLVFPAIGRLFGLDQQQFGTWAALAIHDTSSVVGATAAYGSVALAVGTTVKLARAVWIMPCVAVVGWLKKSGSRVKFPLFIVGFIAAAAIRSLLPEHETIWSALHAVARQALVMTLFLIGAGMSREVLQRVGVRPLALGISLWLAVSGLTLAAITSGLIR